MAEKKTGAGAILAGLAGLTAAAVGAYYLYGHKEAKKHRSQVKGWMLKAKGEVLEELEKAHEVTESAYMSAVDMIAKKYNELKTVDPVELEAFLVEMRDHWNGIKKTMQAHGKAAKTKSAKKPAAKRGKASKK